MVTTDAEDFDELAVPLDLLLTRPVFGLADRVAPNMSWPRFAMNLARQPRTVASRAATLGKELGAIVAGRSTLTPAKGDAGSPTRPGRVIRCSSAPCRRTWPPMTP